MSYDIAHLSSQFDIYGDYVNAVPFGTGHINDTFQVAFDQCGTLIHYTFQRINHNVFKDPVSLMENVDRVTNHISKKIRQQKQQASRHALRLVRAFDGKPYVLDQDGNYWRAYLFIEKVRTYDVLETANQAYQAAKAFAEFQHDLVDLPGGRLNETIPDFHNTPKRIANLEAAIAADKKGRVKEVQREIDFILSRKADASKLLELNATGEIPERITHNDTKLNNVLIDDATGEGVCVIDLDTVMPGLVHYDFGDMVRTGTSPAMEDEKDLSKVSMRFEMFEALLRGYLSRAGKFLTPTERAMLPFSGKLITLEIGTRFLTDYLEGDVYFKIHREEQNLDRCRTQLKLVESIEEQMDKMQQLLESINE